MDSKDPKWRRKTHNDMDDDEEYPEPGDIEVCPICERENCPDEYDMCEHHWAARVDGEIQSNDPKFLQFCSSWEAALKTMSEALDRIEKRSDSETEKAFDEIPGRYGFSDYAPGIDASAAFTDLVECFVGDDRAGGLGGMGLTLENTIFLESADKIDLAIARVHALEAEVRQFLKLLVK